MIFNEHELTNANNVLFHQESTKQSNIYTVNKKINIIYLSLKLLKKGIIFLLTVPYSRTLFYHNLLSTFSKYKKKYIKPQIE